MKHLFYTFQKLLLFFSFAFLAHSSFAQGSPLDAFTAPVQSLACSTFTVSASGWHGCANASLTGSSVTVSGSRIHYNIFVTQPFICLPALVAWSRTSTVAANTIPPGSYTIVGRYVLNGSPIDSLSRSIVIGSCCAASPSFAVSDTLICPGDSISFRANDTTLNSYAWKLNGSTFSSTASSMQTFTQPGNYTVSLVVGNTMCSDSVDKMITVSTLPQATISNPVFETCPGSSDGGASLTVTGGNSPYSVTWSNGDTTNDLSMAGAGKYYVSVVDNLGCPAAIDSITIISGPPVTASFTQSVPAICPGDVVTFTSTSMGGNTFDWQLAGQSQATTQMASFALIDTGFNTVSLIVSFSGACTDTATGTVYVEDPPTAIFSQNTLQVICPGDTVDFTNLSVRGKSFEWLLDGQQLATSTDFSHVFPDTGNYVVTLIATGTLCSDTMIVPFTVAAPPSITGRVVNQTCPGDMDGLIDLTLIGGVNPFTYSWSNGAGTEDLTFLDSGTYIVTIMDAAGCISQDTFQVGTDGGVTANYTLTLSNDTLTVMDLSSANALTWDWDFGDGNSSTNPNNTHVFQGNDQFIVCLTVTDLFGCMDTKCDTIMVAVGLTPFAQQTLEVYPNPADQAIVLNLQDLVGKQVEIRLFDELGRKVLEQNQIATERHQLNISDLSKGIYLLQVIADGGFYRTKIVKE